MEPFKKILSDRRGPLTLSPALDIHQPGSMRFRDANAYRRLFSGFLVKRSPARVGRNGLFQAYLNRACLLKLEDDLIRKFDVSVVPYPLKLDLRAWGVVLDPIGRIWGVRTTDADLLEFEFHGGYCRSKQEWDILVGKKLPDEADSARRFYNRARQLSGGRIVLAGTLGFGLWDALWMAFDFERAYRLLTNDFDFAVSVFTFWQRCHVAAAMAMLDAGIKLIMFREHPGGFPASRGLPEKLDPYIRGHLQELSKMIHSRGGCIFLDCDADDIFESDYPSQWGFDGIGPLRFRDEQDLLAARRSMSEDLFLIGTTITPSACRSAAEEMGLAGKVMITNRLDSIETAAVSHPDRPENGWSAILPEGMSLAS